MTYCHVILSYYYNELNISIVIRVRHGMIKQNVIVIPIVRVILSDLDIVIKLSVIITLLHIYYPVCIVLSIEKILIMCNKLKVKTMLGKYTRKGRGWCKKRRFTEKK